MSKESLRKMTMKMSALIMKQMKLPMGGIQSGELKMALGGFNEPLTKNEKIKIV